MEGKQNPQPYVKILRNGKTGSDDLDVSAVSIIDADGGLGIHIGPMAMKLAIQKAKKYGIGCVIVKNAGHLGGAGYHAGLAAKEGCIGQVGIPNMYLSKGPIMYFFDGRSLSRHRNRFFI